jgi:hypothetical protein
MRRVAHAEGRPERETDRGAEERTTRTRQVKTPFASAKPMSLGEALGRNDVLVSRSRAISLAWARGPFRSE